MMHWQRRFYWHAQLMTPKHFPFSSAVRVLDWDRRKFIVVILPEQLNLDDDWSASRLANRYVDTLDPQVVAFAVSDDEELISTCSAMAVDETTVVHYPYFHGSLSRRDTVVRTQLAEVERLSNGVDRVLYMSDGNLIEAVFKYTLLDDNHMESIWNELYVLKALRGHPSIIPFDRVVLDELEGRVVGFTTPFIPNGNLDTNTTVPFRFSWIQQLTALVDELNLRHGIIHNDLQPQNLLVNATGDLVVFDFNRCRRLNHRWVGWGAPLYDQNIDVDRVVFTIYTLITLDDHFHTDSRIFDISEVQGMVHWPAKRPLEEGTDLAACRDFLTQWVADRRTRRTIQHHSEATEPLEWPEKPARQHVRYEYVRWTGIDQETDIDYVPRLLPQLRRDGPQEGRQIISWERPSQKLLDQVKALQDKSKMLGGNRQENIDENNRDGKTAKEEAATDKTDAAKEEAATDKTDAAKEGAATDKTDTAKEREVVKKAHVAKKTHVSKKAHVAKKAHVVEKRVADDETLEREETKKRRTLPAKGETAETSGSPTEHEPSQSRPKRERRGRK